MLSIASGGFPHAAVVGQDLLPPGDVRGEYTRGLAGARRRGGPRLASGRRGDGIVEVDPGTRVPVVALIGGMRSTVATWFVSGR